MPLFRYLCNKYSDARLACGQQAGRFCFGRHQEFTLLPNGLDSAKFNQATTAQLKQLRQEFNIPADHFIVGHVGRFEPQKNHTFIVQLLKDYLPQHPKTSFILIGEGPLKTQIMQEIRRFDKHNQVIFSGSRQDINYCMQLFDAFILPSLFEGLPLVAIEAQAAGTPCLFADTIDPDADIQAGLVNFFSIKQGSADWIHALDHIQTHAHRADKAHIQHQLKTHHYELQDNVATLAHIYRKLAKE